MIPAHQKILAEVTLKENKTESGLVMAAEAKHKYLEAVVVGAGEETHVKEGDTIVVFGVYDAQIHDYNGKKLIFVDAKEGQFFKV